MHAILNGASAAPGSADDGEMPLAGKNRLDQQLVSWPLTSSLGWAVLLLPLLFGLLELLPDFLDH
jgi:hypothetical protein